MSQLIFDKYAIVKRLALGGMGEVFLAREQNEVVDRLVILKSLLPELAEQEGFVGQFLDEARVAATLNHPNIVSIYEVGLWQGIYFIVMEHIHGGDLARLVRSAAKNDRGVPFLVSARIVMDAALGLHHAHEATDVNGQPLYIVHRDISPQNIMVRGDGVTKVVDFGIAKAANRVTRTATGLLKGKLQYMPPEQVRGGDVDARADQFSLGVVLWELCCGRRLFKGENELQTLERVLKEPIPKPSSISPDIPKDLENIILRMLQRDPERRFPSCQAVATALGAVLESAPNPVGTRQVAAFVNTVIGDELKERTQNLGPSKANFMITLGDQNASEFATPTVHTNFYGQKKSYLRAAIAIGLVGAIALAGVVTLAYVNDAPPEQPIAEIGGESKTPTEPTKPAVEVEPTKLVVTSVPPGAAVRIAGEIAGYTPFTTTKLPAVEHTISLYASGYKKMVRQVLLKAGEVTTLDVELEKRKRRAPGKPAKKKQSKKPDAVKVVQKTPVENKEPGYFTVSASPWANVTIDGRSYATTPLSKVKLSAGRHKVVLRTAAGKSSTRWITIRSGQTTKKRYQLE